MKDAGILEGDYVVVHPQDTAKDGDVVVALLGEEATVKRYFREPDHIRLQPENETMEPIRSKEVKVLGRVVGLPAAGLTARGAARATLFTDAAPRARLAAQIRQPRGRKPSRKVRTSQGRVVEVSTRGNPRESATETNRLRRAVPRERRAGKGEMVR